MAERTDFDNCPHVSGVKARLYNLERGMADQAKLLKEGQKLFEKVDRRLLTLTFAVAIIGVVCGGSALAVNGNLSALFRLLAGVAVP